MNFFQYQSVIPYTYQSANGDTYTMSITNITQRARLAERLRQFTSVMHDYIVQDGERPDSVATVVYGDPKYTWVILLVNNIFSLYDWPLSYDEFQSYIVKKYGSVENANNGTPYYFTSDGIQVDADTYAALPLDQVGVIRSPLDQETLDNENKRRIKVISAQFLSGIDQVIRTLYK